MAISQYALHSSKTRKIVNGEKQDNESNWFLCVYNIQIIPKFAKDLEQLRDPVEQFFTPFLFIEFSVNELTISKEIWMLMKEFGLSSGSTKLQEISSALRWDNCKGVISSQSSVARKIKKIVCHRIWKWIQFIDIFRRIPCQLSFNQNHAPHLKEFRSLYNVTELLLSCEEFFICLLVHGQAVPQSWTLCGQNCFTYAIQFCSGVSTLIALL